MNLLLYTTALFAAEAGLEIYMDKTLSHTERFAALVNAYESSLLQYVRRLKGSMRIEAEDFVQEVFLRFHHKVQTDGWDSIASPNHWLYRVAHNLVMDSGRRQTLENQHQRNLIQESFEEVANFKEGCLEEMIQEEEKVSAMGFLQRLPEEDREVLLLKIFENMTLKEISEITGENLGKTAYRINRSLATLAKLMKEIGFLES